MKDFISGQRSLSLLALAGASFPAFSHESLKSDSGFWHTVLHYGYSPHHFGVLIIVVPMLALLLSRLVSEYRNGR